MFFRWLRSRRRRKLLETPFPKDWEPHLANHVRHYAALGTAEQLKVRNSLRVFVAEKNWEGCGGLVMTDEIKVTIAAQMGVLTLGFQEEYFDNVLSILVYPHAYMANEKQRTAAGVVIEGQSAREGEAWYRGPVILSWSDVVHSGRGRNRGHNLVFHEFAHQLDMLNGQQADGVPPMSNNEQARRWIDTLNSEFRKLENACEDGRHTVLDCYGTKNRAEFFAVATEAFFERPKQLQQQHAALFANLCEYYGQTPPH